MFKPYQFWSKGDHLAYFKGNLVKLEDKWTRLRNIAKNISLSTQAQLRLEWIIFYYTVAGENATATANHFGISRKTFHKWHGRFDERNLHSLEDHSRAPKNPRCWEVNLKEESRVIHLRKRHMKYGKKKLKVIYQREYGETISTWKIERVIRKHQLFPDKQVYKRRLKKKARRAKKSKRLIFDVERKLTFGHLWHIDCIILWWYGIRRVIFTALEDLSKIAYARVYTTNTAGYAEDFLKRLMYLVEGKVEIMHSDNGSEFEGEFAKACEKLEIEQVFSRTRHPKDNPALERFNWTVQDEWLGMSEVGLDDILEANCDLSEWLVEYNNYRPHETLDYMTPLEYSQKHFFKVSPMWSARTCWALLH